jgi:hypothetical protein
MNVQNTSRLLSDYLTFVFTYTHLLFFLAFETTSTVVVKQVRHLLVKLFVVTYLIHVSFDIVHAQNHLDNQWPGCSVDLEHISRWEQCPCLRFYGRLIYYAERDLH